VLHLHLLQGEVGGPGAVQPHALQRNAGATSAVGAASGNTVNVTLPIRNFRAQVSAVISPLAPSLLLRPN
jgi:hypothetical protein